VQIIKQCRSLSSSLRIFPTLNSFSTSFSCSTFSVLLLFGLFRFGTHQMELQSLPAHRSRPDQVSDTDQLELQSLPAHRSRPDQVSDTDQMELQSLSVSTKQQEHSRKFRCCSFLTHTVETFSKYFTVHSLHRGLHEIADIYIYIFQRQSFTFIEDFLHSFVPP
jgi:hypothetical protein